MSSRDRNGPPRRLSSASATGTLAGLAAILGAAPIAAQTMTHLEANAKVVASDNPFLLDGDNNGAAAFELAVNPEIRWSLAPATTFQLSGQAAYRRYLSKYGDFLTGRADASLTHRDSEYLSFDTRLSFARELPADALTESIDYSADPRTVRERFLASSTIRWTPDSYTELTGSGAWEKLRYPEGSALLSSTSAYRFELGANRRIDPYTSIGLAGRTTQTRSDGIGDLSASGLFITVAHRFAPNVEANGQIGVEWTDYDLADSGRARLSGSGNLCYRPEFTDLCVTMSLQSEVSGLGGLQREFNTGVTLRRRISEHDTVSAAAEYRQADIGGLGLNTSAMRLNTTYEHRLDRRLSLTGSVDYLSRKFLSAVRNNAVVVQIGITFGRES